MLGVLLVSFPILLVSVTAPESAAFETILRHHRLILEAIQQRPEPTCSASEEEHLAETVKEVRWERETAFGEFRGVDAQDRLPSGGRSSRPSHSV